MPSSSANVTSKPARIDQTTNMGVGWGGVALTVLFFAFRVAIRFKVFGRLHIDDGLVLFAWIALLLNTLVWQFAQDGYYENYAITSGQLFPPPTGFEHRMEQSLRMTAAVFVFFYTGLWSIKLSFLVFFKRLGHSVRNQHIVWWAVLTFTLASYVACLGTIDYRCLVSQFSDIKTRCGTNAPDSIKSLRATIRSNMVLDVVTDALIILVPVSLLWKVRLSIRKKFALSGIFCITVIIMVFAIIRVVVVTSYSQLPDQTWLYMWSSIEQAVSIIVACLASFPSLFKKSERAKHQRLPESTPEPDASSRWVFFTRKSKPFKKSTSDIAMNKVGLQQASNTIHAGKGSSAPWIEHQELSFGSSEFNLSLNKAHIGVQTDIEVAEVH